MLTTRFCNAVVFVLRCSPMQGMKQTPYGLGQRHTPILVLFHDKGIRVALYHREDGLILFLRIGSGRSWRFVPRASASNTEVNSYFHSLRNCTSILNV